MGMEVCTMDFKPADIFSSRSTHSSNRFAVASLALLVVVLSLDPRSVTGADSTTTAPVPASNQDVQKLLKDLRIPSDDSEAVDLSQALQSTEVPPSLSDDDKARWKARRLDAA